MDETLHPVPITRNLTLRRLPAGLGQATHLRVVIYADGIDDFTGRQSIMDIIEDTTEDAIAQFNAERSHNISVGALSAAVTEFVPWTKDRKLPKIKGEHWRHREIREEGKHAYDNQMDEPSLANCPYAEGSLHADLWQQGYDHAESVFYSD